MIVISIIAAAQPPARLRDIVSGSSTDLVNLGQRPLAVLFASAFVVSPVWGLWIVAPMVVAYGALQRWLGRASVIVVAVLGHVGATLETQMTAAYRNGHLEALPPACWRWPSWAA